jgi:CDP-ribitol ribitolphosphotransferase / teichoic acid ribitol-phosphate polymerase
MKIDKKNPWHWLYLLVSGMWVMVAIAARPFRSRKDKKIVVLYGHKFNGNLKAFADYCAARNDPNIQCYFLTMDPAYYKEVVLTNPSVPILLMTRLADMLIVGRSDAVITDHGLHTLTFLHKITDVPFIDVWHGIPYKGFVAEDFVFMKDYAEVWVSSPWMRDLYISRLKFQPEQVKATGYARVDRLVKNDYSPEALRGRYGIEDHFKHIVVVAPTWKQDAEGRSIVPFGATEQEFFEALNVLGDKLNALIIFRAHLNVGDAASYASLDFVRNMPYALYPVAEDFMALADVLVTDWSSIAFDYLPLHRPTIFLDVEPPFKHDLIMGKDQRFGAIVRGVDALAEAIERGITKPQEFVKDYVPLIKKTEHMAYGNTLDGRSAERCYDQLKGLLS